MITTIPQKVQLVYKRRGVNQHTQTTYSLYSQSSRVGDGWTFVESSRFRVVLVDKINRLVTELYPPELRDDALNQFRIVEQF